jgi:putative heme iron utilization protein
VTRAPRLRELLEAERHAVLATVSARRAGWPFASITAYAVLPNGEPLLLLSELAEHTRNVRGDPRASLLVQESEMADDPQAGARVTLLGRMELHDSEEARNLYVARHRQAREYFVLGDFHLWVLRVEEARFVNGFGDMGWLAGDDVRAALAE